MFESIFTSSFLSSKPITLHLHAVHSKTHQVTASTPLLPIQNDSVKKHISNTSLAMLIKELLLLFE